MRDYSKIKIFLPKAAFVCGLFLAAFFLGFYVVNMDFSGVADKESAEKGQGISFGNEQLAQKMGNISFALESYEDFAARYALIGQNAAMEADADKDGLVNYAEYVHGTNPILADTDGDKFSDRQELSNGYDPAAPGDAKPWVTISIAKIGVEAPLVWSKSLDENEQLKDLEKGLSHFPKTAAPGQIGNMVISGHSSNYFWAKGDYNHVFKDLGDLSKGDVVKVKVVQNNGRMLGYEYEVTESFVTAPDDERIFADSDKETLTLSTCWPLGTNFKRIIVKAQLVR